MKIGEGQFWIWGGTHLGRVAHIWNGLLELHLICMHPFVTFFTDKYSYSWHILLFILRQLAVAIYICVGIA